MKRRDFIKRALGVLAAGIAFCRPKVAKSEESWEDVLQLRQVDNPHVVHEVDYEHLFAESNEMLIACREIQKNRCYNKA